MIRNPIFLANVRIIEKELARQCELIAKTQSKTSFACDQFNHSESYTLFDTRWNLYTVFDTRWNLYKWHDIIDAN